MYAVSATQLFRRQLRKLPKDVQIEVNKIVENLKNGSETGKPLKGLLNDCLTINVKRDYRLIYMYHGSQNRIDLVFIALRKNVYRELERLRRQDYI